MDSLLVSLRKYRPRENTDPIENFITEAFAWLLRNNQSLGKYFIDCLNKRLGDDSLPITTEEINWSTQKNFAGKFPDMVAEFNEHTLIFEHKVWSSLHDEQLYNYKKYAEDNRLSYCLILITADESQFDQNPSLALCWRDVYQILSEWQSLPDANDWHVSDFLYLLKEEGLGPKAPMSHTGILNYIEAIQLEEQAHSIVSTLATETWEGMEQFNVKVDKRYGRMGLMFAPKGEDSTVNSEEWLPGIFVGLLLDPRDHSVLHRVTKGPNFVLVLSFNEPLHKKYDDEVFVAFREKLESNSEGTNWQLYNHLSDKDISSKDINLWHPYYLEQPMLEIFKGTEKFEEQRDIFRAAAKELLDIANRENALQELKTGLSSYFS